MRIFVSEYITAMGIGQSSDSPSHSMWLEGDAMREAIEADFRAIPGVTGCTSNEADWRYIIAPESDGILERLARRQRGFLGPSPDVIAVTSDKLRTYECWKSAGVTTPETHLLDPTLTMEYPRIVKPRDGAGSMETYVIHDDEHYKKLLPQLGINTVVQPYCQGIAASVAFLCRGREFYPLLPCLQLISDDGRCRYLGGVAPLPGKLGERAVAIARQALEAIPGEFLGYVGVDVLLGEPDLAIEINPRLTTSYLGLRNLADFNIAETMLKLAMGEPIGNLRWRSGSIRWYPGGRTEWLTPTAKLNKLLS